MILGIDLNQGHQEVIVGGAKQFGITAKLVKNIVDCQSILFDPDIGLVVWNPNEIPDENTAWPIDFFDTLIVSNDIQGNIEKQAMPRKFLPNMLEAGFKKIVIDPKRDSIDLILEKCIKNILNDGRVDESDIPEFIFLIMEAYNSLPEARLSKEEMPVFISCIFNYLVEKYNLIPLEQRDKYEKMVVSSIKLVLMMPQFKTITRWICPCW